MNNPDYEVHTMRMVLDPGDGSLLHDSKAPVTYAITMYFDKDRPAPYPYGSGKTYLVHQFIATRMEANKLRNRLRQSATLPTIIGAPALTYLVDPNA